MRSGSRLRYMWRAASLFTVCACNSQGESGRTFDVDLPSPVTLVSLDSEIIGQPTGISLDQSGQLWIADALIKRVIAVNAEGHVIQRIDREGDGPGELRSPVAVAASDTLIRVIDSQHMRIQDYRPDGTYLKDFSVPSPFLGAGSVALDGRLVVPTMGRDSALARVRTVSDTGSTPLGPAVAPAPAGFDFVAMKAAIADGRVPDQFRNQTMPVVGSEGTTWVLVQTEAQVRRYAPDGRLLWTQTLDVPEVEQAHREFFRRNAEETNPSRIYALLTFSGAREVGRDVWILMFGEASHPAVFYVLDIETGDVRGRLSVATAAPSRQFAVDAVRRQLYLAVPDESAIVRVDLSGLPREAWRTE
jgi:hypothetical protein